MNYLSMITIIIIKIRVRLAYFKKEYFYFINFKAFLI